MRIRTKLILLLIALAIAILLAAGVFTTITLDNYLKSRVVSEMGRQADEFAYVVQTAGYGDSSGYRHLQQLAHAADLRLTLITEDGKVVFESDLPPAQLSQLENHLHRPEIQQALKEGAGVSTRHSATLNSDMFYYTKKVSIPLSLVTGAMRVAFVRVSIPITQVNELLDQVRSKVIWVSLCVLLVVIAATFIISTKLAAPLREMERIATEIHAGNLEKRMPVRSNDELGRLGTTLNRMIDRLNQDISKLKKLERIRNEFLGNVSHELRTPIFAIQGMLETLLQGAIDDSEVSRTFLERALQNAQRLNTLLGDLIEISRIESGEMRMSFRYFSLEEFLSSVVSEMQPIASRQGITLECRCPGNPVTALGDKEWLKQAMINLIENAIKYNRPNGRVEISYVQAGQRVQILVLDTGVGIPSEHIPRIFERFYRVDKERSREAGGTGLGLAIVKHIIEAHESKMEVESEPGKGSVFSFTLKA